MTVLTVLEPVPDKADIDVRPLAPRGLELSGVKLGLLDNGKPNSGAYLDLLSVELAEAYGVEVVMRLRKPGMGQTAPPAMISSLATHCDVVVTGVGDCSGCCVCSAHDGIVLENAGIPSTTVCTSEFLDAARGIAGTLGMPRYPFVVIDHPFGSRDQDDLRALATATRERVAWALASADPTTAGSAPANAPAAVTNGVDCAC